MKRGQLSPITTDTACCDCYTGLCSSTTGSAAETHTTPTIHGTVKPFNLAALKVDDFACKIILAPFILANWSRTIPTHE